MQLIPSLDLLGGRVVRLERGDFATARDYGDPAEVLRDLRAPSGSRLHVVDLEGSRTGRPVVTSIVRRLAAEGLDLQVGGGIRTLDDARQWFDCGAARVVVGTVAAENPALLASLVSTFGAERVIPAVDVRDEVVRTSGWERNADIPLSRVFAHIERLGIVEALVTDISRDGLLRGPSFELYRRLRDITSVRVIASGGVTTISDLLSLSRLENVSACVVGRAMLERRIDLADATARLAVPNTLPERVIPCLDVRDGRVVKGVAFEQIRDAGDPAECAVRYEEEGADELVMLDISATDRGASTAIETVRRVAGSIFIPLTVGGGVRTLEDFRRLLQAGADRVALNSAALHRPELIRECASEFGAQAVVVACDARRQGDGWKAAARGGRVITERSAIAWCAEAEALGAGEILLTSVDRDGTGDGFDLDLLRAVTSRLQIGVIASGGAGRPEHFRDAIESGGARAVLAASLFHDRRLAIADLKTYLQREGMSIR
jgi:cyclase